ncbi:MAG TPA: response regulator [Planctomycetota bacterium]|nr:response regulator [Planctomycetota bacterium]
MSARILVAEDDPAIRMVFTRLLEGAGHKVTPCVNGHAALEQVEKGERFDLVITDLNMPGLAGDELLRKLKERTPFTPVIVVTGVRDIEAIEECFKSDAYRYLRKPFTKDELLGLVKQALHEASTSSGRFSRVRRDAEGWVELTAPSRQEYLDRFQEFCDAILDSRLDEKARNELKIAVQELGQNAIEWGNKLDRNSTIRIAWKLEADKIVIRIADDGPGFDPSAVPDPTIDPIATIENREKVGKRPGGFGIHLARRVMDRVSYNERGNIVYLEKKLS